jgi:hypothetical protein
MNSINNQSEALKKAPTDKELNHAFRVVKDQITTKRIEMASATGEARAKLETEIKNLIASIGLDTTELEIEPEASATGAAADGVGAKILVGLAKINSEAAKLTGEAAAGLAAANEKPSLWARFKAWVGENKKKAVAGALTIFAGAAGLWFWLRGKNINTAVSSVSRMTDTAAADTATEVPVEDAGSTVFTRIGEWFVNAGVTVKGWFVSAYTWVKNLFNRTTTATEATGEANAEAVPAGA